MNTLTIVSEKVLKEVQDFTTEFLFSEKKMIERSVKEEGQAEYTSSTSMCSKYDVDVVGNIETNMDENTFVLDMYVTIPEENKKEVVFLSYNRAFGKNLLLMSTESQPKALEVELDTIPAIASLEKLLSELKH